jgi:hypothetical protein
MSYCREPYYIYPNVNETVVFDSFGSIPDEVVNIFLYKIYNFRNEEFMKRVENGRKALEEWDSKPKENIKQEFEQFLKDNKEKLYEMAEKNTTRNKQGQVVITKDDEWRNEDVWENE